MLYSVQFLIIMPAQHQESVERKTNKIKINKVKQMQHRVTANQM
jgi:hypothetical protein